MTIAQAFNEIAIAQGGTPNNGGTIAGAIDALNDVLAGSDQPAANTIEGAVRLLGEHIGGGGGDTQYPVIQYDNDTALLDWTWQQIKDALDGGKKPLIYRIGTQEAEAVLSATGNPDDGYMVTSKLGSAVTMEYETDTADGYPTDD